MPPERRYAGDRTGSTRGRIRTSAVRHLSRTRPRHSGLPATNANAPLHYRRLARWQMPAATRSSCPASPLPIFRSARSSTSPEEDFDSALIFANAFNQAQYTSALITGQLTSQDDDAPLPAAQHTFVPQWSQNFSSHSRTIHSARHQDVSKSRRKLAPQTRLSLFRGSGWFVLPGSLARLFGRKVKSSRT